jgi:delta 1-pyrroline-5-carboxylate dehydrogenase
LDALRLGNPPDVTTDIGPVIDADASAIINAYCDEAAARGAVCVLHGEAAGHSTLKRPLVPR